MELISELQSLGLRLDDPAAGAQSRRGGAGPSDHKAVTVDGHTVMIPVHTAGAWSSPYVATQPGADGASRILRDGVEVGVVSFPHQPRFYKMQTFDGIPYGKIATLHGADVLATTILQSCIRYESRRKSCQFCAIGQSLAAGRTILRKTPEQLGEVARAAVLLDGVKHMVMTTGTPNATDRGAQLLCESAFGVKSAVNLPIQGQCEPPDDDAWFRRMADAGIDTLGMHLEAVTPKCASASCPARPGAGGALHGGLRCRRRGVRTRAGQHLHPGRPGRQRRGHPQDERALIALGVYPFVVPFVPISGTPLEDHPSPDAAAMRRLLAPLADMLRAGMRSGDAKAGCGKCGVFLAVFVRKEMT
jgi:biotin synthase-related radical SAM superfamily protein